MSRIVLSSNEQGREGKTEVKELTTIELLVTPTRLRKEGLLSLNFRRCQGKVNLNNDCVKPIVRFAGPIVTPRRTFILRQ